MIIEIAELTIDVERADAFEQAVASCAPLFRAAKGCRSMALQRVIEDPTRYHLLVGWDSVEDHMVHFRESEAFQSWRAAVSGFFVAPPTVVHGETRAHFFGATPRSPAP